MMMTMRKKEVKKEEKVAALVAIANAVDLSTSNVLIFIETAGFNATLELDLKAIADEATSATITRTRA